MRIYALPLAVITIGSAVSCWGQAALTVINYSGYAPSGLAATVNTAFPIAPGSIATAFGAFSSVPEAGAAAQTLNPMARELGGVRVRVNGIEAPLYFASRTQINFVVPVGTPVGRQTVEVVAAGNVVNRGTVVVFGLGPALATSNPQTMQAIVQNQDFSVNAQGQRARRGETIQIYATGCGATTPVSQDGIPPTLLSRATAEVKVLIAAQEAAVPFVGAHPQFPGVCQINAIVPDMQFVTGQVPVLFTVNGVPSNPLNIWVQ